MIQTEVDNMEEKRTKNYYPASQLKYQKTLKAFTIRVKPADFERYTNIAKERGYSLRGFILEALEEKIERV